MTKSTFFPESCAMIPPPFGSVPCVFSHCTPVGKSSIVSPRGPVDPETRNPGCLNLRDGTGGSDERHVEGRAYAYAQVPGPREQDGAVPLPRSAGVPGDAQGVRHRVHG